MKSFFFKLILYLDIYSNFICLLLRGQTDDDFFPWRFLISMSTFNENLIMVHALFLSKIIYIYIYIYIHESHWINIMKVSKELATENTVYSCPFSSKLIVIGSFTYQNSVSVTFFTGYAIRIFFFSRFSVFLLHGLSFSLMIIVAKSCFAQLESFWLKHPYSHTSHIQNQFCPSRNKRFCEIKIIFTINRF